MKQPNFTGYFKSIFKADLNATPKKGNKVK